MKTRRISIEKNLYYKSTSRTYTFPHGIGVSHGDTALGKKQEITTDSSIQLPANMTLATVFPGNWAIFNPTGQPSSPI
jgi:hypothetical protein